MAKFAAMTLEEPIEPEHVEPFLRRKAALQQEIEALQHELDALKATRKETPHHITVEELPEEARFQLGGSDPIDRATIDQLCTRN